MPDERIILEILKQAGVHDFVMSQVKDQDELAHLFVNDFEKLMNICMEGA